MGALDAELFQVIRSGDADAPADARRLLEQGGDPDAIDETGVTALIGAVSRDDARMVAVLLEHGADPYLGWNLMANAEDEPAPRMSWCLRFLIWLGRRMAPEYVREIMDADVILTPASECKDAACVRALMAAGVQPGDFDEEMLPFVIGADRIAPRAITPEIFNRSSFPRFGKANPELSDNSFHFEQIRSGRSGHKAETEIAGKRDYAVHSAPVWSFQRMGRTITRLPDGRWVLVAGEHEDHYDADFCIYNDVTVLDGEGGVQHLLYPNEVFPPTDFHTATLWHDEIVLIGSLGYAGQRPEGETQVLRLSLADFSISPVATVGDKPGWINCHKAELEDARIVVSGGKVEPGYRDLEGRWALDLRAWRCQRLEE